jgi:hypothetical protein
MPRLILPLSLFLSSNGQKRDEREGREGSFLVLALSLATLLNTSARDLFSTASKAAYTRFPIPTWKNVMKNNLHKRQ